MADEVEAKPEDGDGRAITSTIAENVGDDVQQALEELKAKLAQSEKDKEALQSRASAAERSAAEAHARSGNAEDEVRNSQMTVITSAIDMLNAEKASLKAAYRAAREAGDIDQEDEIAERRATNAAKLLNLENGKAAMEAQAKLPVRQMARAVDPVESMARDMEGASSPKAAAWLRQHPEYARDQRLTQRMLAAHNLAITDDLKPETDEYFAHVEKTLKIGHTDERPAPRKEPEDEGVEVALSAAAEPVKTRQQQPAAAPVSRGASNGRTYRLTSEQAEAARISGTSPEEYAKNLEAIRKEQANGRGRPN